MRCCGLRWLRWCGLAQAAAQVRKDTIDGPGSGLTSQTGYGLAAEGSQVLACNSQINVACSETRTGLIIGHNWHGACVWRSRFLTFVIGFVHIHSYALEQLRMAEKSGLYSMLRHPALYEFTQWVFRAERNRAWFADTYLLAQPGERVLDIGCGTAEVLRFLPRVEYVGYEPNPDYVAAARAAHGDAGTFHAGFFGEEEAASLEPVDLVIVGAVLHHMSDEQAGHLFTLLRRVVKPGGRVVSLDCAYAPGQNPISKLLVRLDRGQHARRPEGYRALAAPHFDEVTGEVVHQAWPPYTFWIMTAR